MIRELIDKLKAKKRQLQKYGVNNDITEIIPISEEKDINIVISNQDNRIKIEISDYISIGDFVKKMKSSDEYSVLDLLCNCVLWNVNKQKINKGIYYVITAGKSIYNILFTDEKVEIDERTKIELDEQTQKENIIEERVITFYVNKNKYHYYSAKHESNGNTYYTKYYDKNKIYSLATLYLSEEETYNEINSVIYNLECIEGIENILDIEFLKKYILKDLQQNFYQIKKKL